MPAVSGRFWLRACLAVGVVGIGLGSLRACDLSRNLDALARNVKAATAQEAARAAGEIDANLRQGRAAVESLVADLASGALSDFALSERLEAILAADSELLSVGVAFAPVAGRLNAPYLRRSGDDLERLQLEDRLDYSAPQFAPYRDAIEEGPAWRKPA